MKPKLDHTISHLILTALIVSLRIPNCTCHNNLQQDPICSQPLVCGNIREIGYPFWGHNRPKSCGHSGFGLTCRDNILRLNISSIPYRVLGIDFSSQTLRVSREDLSSTLCPPFLLNTTLNSTLFDFSSTADDQNITLHYGCGPAQLPPAAASNQFDCGVNGSKKQGYFFTGDNATLDCDAKIYVPVSRIAGRALADPSTAGTSVLQDALENGFLIQWSVGEDDCHNCVQSGGLCEHNDWGAGSFFCYCEDGPHNLTCNDSGSEKGLSHLQKYVIIGASLGLSVTVLSSLIRYFFLKKSHKKDQKSNNDHIDKFLLSHGSLAPKRYSYKEIKKMTKSFSDKLGQGGYGTVYKGKLPDGQLVAVKVLTETGDNAEDFINEVSSISKTSHVNIVNLVGFCYKRNKRALVYEFMTNNSLDNFISDKTPPELEWEKLFEIAVGVARGLEYLHRGCNTRIVHFDIKPQNILLDEDFCPKISDFGLAKLFNRKQSIISIIGTRGTVGYIAPEVFSRSFGVVSHKSDVYSYGMMLLEMAGAKNRVEIDSGVNYFPDKIYDRVLLETYKLDDPMIKEDEEIERKMVLVGVWCIQMFPADRPSMTKVVEMLEGPIESIQIPPKPFDSSPMPSTQSYSSSSSTTLEVESSTEGQLLLAGGQTI